MSNFLHREKKIPPEKVGLALGSGSSLLPKK